jgi:hypothetical protein
MSKVHFMLMENTLQLKSDWGLKYIFDIKGSSVNRQVKGTLKSSTTLKDTNFLKIRKLFENQKKKPFIDLSPAVKIQLKQAIRKDVDFLASQGIMDYSLLLAIERSPDIFEFRAEPDIDEKKKTFKVSRTKTYNEYCDFLEEQHSFQEGNYIYHVAIIDYL